MARLAASPLSAFETLLSPDLAVDRESVLQVPGWKGAYVLALFLERPLNCAFAGNAVDLAPGWYAYCGSANGPGGIGGRLRRHFRRDKQRHWHVDALTLAAARIEAVAIRSGSECDAVTRLAASGGFTFPLAGFGSSDCRTCTAHLLGWRH